MNFTVNLHWKVLCKSNTEDSKLKLSTNFYISVQQTMNIVVHCYNCILKNMVDAGGGGGVLPYITYTGMCIYVYVYVYVYI